jgi:1-acyl-sn-glycerol-3-phosphate acyltransferase
VTSASADGGAKAGAPDEQGAADRILGIASGLAAELHPDVPVAPLRLRSRLDADFGIDSLALVEFRSRVEEAFGVVLADDVFASGATPEDWLRAVWDARGQPVTEPLLDPVTSSASRDQVGAEPLDAKTLVDALAWHADHHPDQQHARVLHLPGSAAPVDTSYGELAGRSRELASGLRQRGIEPGEAVALMLPTHPDYFDSFFGVLLAGCVPVPLYPPSRPSLLEDHLRRQARILRDVRAVLLIADETLAVPARLLRADVPELQGCATADELRSTGRDRATLPVVRAEDTALIQYSSGSTGNPKGVVLSHEQLLANIRTMGAAVKVSTADTFVSWLPLYHDMGLIGGWLTSLYFGYTFAVMSPLSFLARPARWLQAFGQLHGTLSASPNFGYDLCVRHVTDDELAGVDLSSWRLACNGAEPVSANTIRRFIDRFEPYGFRPETMAPVYGLAETGVGLTFPPLGRPPLIDPIDRETLARSGRAVPTQDEEHARLAVSCGLPLPGYEVRIVDETGREAPERVEGEVEFRGPSATSGYFGDSFRTEALYHGDWLDTGDVGYLAAGELYLTGRAKDLVIRAGRNLHPEEIEEAIGEVRDVRRGCVAAFASDDPRFGTERLVVVAETNLAREDSEARRDLQQRIAAATIDVAGATPDEIVLAPPGSVLKTPSGKIRRAATRDRYEHREIGKPALDLRWQMARFAWSTRARQMRRLGRSAHSLAAAGLIWAVVILGGAPVWLGVYLLPTVRLRWRLVRTAGRVLGTAAGVHFEVSGTLPAMTGPYVAAANHMSFVDGLALIEAFESPLVFVAGDELAEQRLAGPFLRRLGCEFVNREAVAKEVAGARKLTEVLRSGRPLAVFPEGGVDRAVGVRPFHLGAFGAAAEVGVPVVPVGIRKSRDVVRPGEKFPRRGLVEVVIGDAIWPRSSGWDAALQLSTATRLAICDLSGEKAVG